MIIDAKQKIIIDKDLNFFMKKILFLIFSVLSVLTFAALPESENFSAWKSSNLPGNWSFLTRKDRLNKIEKTADGILLNGMIISDKVPFKNGGSDVKITLKTKSIKKFLKVYLFYYYNSSDKIFKQVGQAFDLKQSDANTYVTSLKLSRRGQKFYSVVLDGAGAEVESIEFAPIEKSVEKDIPCEIPVIFNAKAPNIAKINLAEWQQSFKFINPFRSTSQKVNFIDSESVAIQTDGKKIYFLFSTPNYSSSRRTIRDSEIFKDSSVELVFQPEKLERTFHIVVNLDGAIYDEEIAVGQSFVNWNCPGIEIGKGRNGKNFLLAIAIPFASLKINPADKWQMNICRNRPEYSEFAAMNHGGYLKNLMNAGIVRDIESCLVNIDRRDNNFVFQAQVKSKDNNIKMNVAEYGGFKFKAKKAVKSDSKTTEIITERKEIPNGTFEFTLSNKGRNFFRTDVQFGKMEAKAAGKETLSHFIY